MSKANDPLVTDELWNTIVPLLPTHPPSPKGGRRRIPDRCCLNGILFVLREGIRWQSLPASSGWGSGSTCWRRFAEWTAAGVWEKTHAHLIAALGERGLLDLERAVVDSTSVRALRGGEHTGPNPTDRAKKGCKRHLISDGVGIPLVVQIGPANRRDEQWLPCLLWCLWIVLSYGWRRRPAALQGGSRLRFRGLDHAGLGLGPAVAAGGAGHAARERFRADPLRGGADA